MWLNQHKLKINVNGVHGHTGFFKKTAIDQKVSTSTVKQPMGDFNLTCEVRVPSGNQTLQWEISYIIQGYTWIYKGCLIENHP